MNFLFNLAVLASLATAAVVPAQFLARELSLAEQRDTACTNTATTRACWNNGYSIATDFDQKHPTTGKTVTYDFEITNGTCNPDGAGSRICFLINGQYPGPTIVADWGDEVVVNVKNSLQHNGTAIHFHGVRQLGTCGADGVPGITQCPIAPTQSWSYRFQATQFGTSWYHSHFSNQYGDGVVGPMIFHGPASANYDIDLGTYALSDWFYKTAYQIGSLSRSNLQQNKGPPNGDTILINGTNKNANGGGQYNHVQITSGKKYRLRLVNMAVDSYIRVSLDNHTMQVMTSDYIPIKPFSTQWLLLGIGQRYDVVITANQTAGNYWFRAEAAADCLSINNFRGRAVWSYDTVPVADPTSPSSPTPTDCLEPTTLSAYWVQPVPSSSFSQVARNLDINVTSAQAVPGSGDTIVVWALNQTSLSVDWREPTLSHIFAPDPDFPARAGVLPALPEGGWNFWLVQQAAGAPAIPHPVHLHGHDFFVLGEGARAFDGTATLDWATPPRRDTATVYGGGWLAIAFRSDNPGAWLMHCHIAWHVSQGLGMQFVEATEEMTLPDRAAYEHLCDSWERYEETMVYEKDDSGV